MGFPRPYGRYILEDRLAMGGMAEIFRARTATTGFEKRVCIKRVLPHLSAEDDFVTMFRDEAKTAARLQHANVVQVFDFGEVVDDHDDSKSTLFLAMELIEGHDLRKLADASRKKGIPFSVGEVTQIGIEMCRGLHHAHTLRDESGALLGVVHRDISPHNVLVSKQGEVKITDFGIAKAAERATHTSTGIVKGKVAYMSPEQAEGKPFDHRLDQWATGVVLWELLCGERLFRGENDATILRKVLNVEVPAPTSLRADVPKELEQIVLRALSGEPEQRFADMRQMELALSRFLFSGAIDPADAEVRTAYARIMDGMVSAPRKTNIMPAAAVEPAPAPPAPTVILRDEQRHAEEAPRAPRLSMATDESQVFVSSAKLPAAPRGSILPASAVEPAPPTELVEGDVAADAAAAAAAILEAQARARAAPSIAVGAANDTLELPSLIASVPTTPERSRSQRPAAGPITMIADGDLAAAARAIGDDAAIAADTTIADDDLDGTPATRTLVPAQELSSTTAPAAIVVKPTVSITDGTTRDELLPKSRAPMLAAGGLGVGAIIAVIGLAFSGTAPTETATATTTPTTPTTTAPAATTTTPSTTPPPVVEAPPVEAPPVEAPPAEAAPPTPEPAAIVAPPPPTVSSTPTPTPATPAPKAATPKPTSSTASSTKKVEADDEEPAPRGTPGSVYVDVPGGWATVSIGKKVYGETPVTLTLPAGKYTVTLTSGDGAKKKNVPLVVVAGKKAQIREAL